MTNQPQCHIIYYQETKTDTEKAGDADEWEPHAADFNGLLLWYNKDDDIVGTQ